MKACGIIWQTGVFVDYGIKRKSQSVHIATVHVTPVVRILTSVFAPTQLFVPSYILSILYINAHKLVWSVNV